MPSSPSRLNAERNVRRGMPYAMTVRGPRAEATAVIGFSPDARTSDRRVDERFTTKRAEHTLHELGIDERRGRGKKDQIAAVFILQDYLSTVQMRTNNPPECHEQ